jgi:hypothetical protein
MHRYTWANGKVRSENVTTIWNIYRMCTILLCKQVRINGTKDIK